MQTNIRSYRPRDLAAVLRAWEDASRLAHPFLADEYFEQEKSRIPRVHLPKANTLVAEAGDRVVGFIALLGNQVGALFVQPEYHGTGVGRALMDEASDLHEVLEVEVFANNTIGRQFYCRYGFVEIDERLHRETGQTLLHLRYSAGNKAGNILKPVGSP